ncbi:MAG: tryptophan synthase subunit alpha [Planctomycetota bacterium]
MANRIPSKIDQTFQSLKAANRAAFIPFYVAGDPDLATSEALICAAAANGADLIEIGVPFSDPIADGPVIQAAYFRALNQGFKVKHLFELARNLRAGGVMTPLVTMVSYSLVFKYGLNAFLKASKDAGYDGLIIPDLPAGYEGDAAEASQAAGLDLVFLIAPTTPLERRGLIAEKSRGFIYYISVAGITGARTALPPDLADNIRDIKSRTTTPVCVGFGISVPEQAASVCGVADGAIVGSALVRKSEEATALNLTGDAFVKHVTDLAKALADAAHTSKS